MNKMNVQIDLSNYDSNTGSGTCTYGLWGAPAKVEINEYTDRIEIVYKQASMATLTSYLSPAPIQRVYKVVFSCKEGKWNKSEPIIGKIIPSQGEYYVFEDCKKENR